MSETASHLKRPVYPMPDFVLEAPKSKRLVAAYNSCPPYQRNDYVWLDHQSKTHSYPTKTPCSNVELEHGDVYMNMAYRAKGGGK